MPKAMYAHGNREDKVMWSSWEMHVGEVGGGTERVLMDVIERLALLPWESSTEDQPYAGFETSAFTRFTCAMLA